MNTLYKYLRQTEQRLQDSIIQEYRNVYSLHGPPYLPPPPSTLLSLPSLSPSPLLHSPDIQRSNWAFIQYISLLVIISIYSHPVLLLTFRLSIQQCIYLSSYLSIYLSGCLSVYIFFQLSIHSSIDLSVFLFI